MPWGLICFAVDIVFIDGKLVLPCDLLGIFYYAFNVDARQAGD